MLVTIYVDMGIFIRPGKIIFSWSKQTHVKKHLSRGIGDRKYQRKYITLKKMAAIEESMSPQEKTISPTFHFDTRVKGERSFQTKSLLVQLG